MYGVPGIVDSRAVEEPPNPPQSSVFHSFEGLPQHSETGNLHRAQPRLGQGGEAALRARDRRRRLGEQDVSGGEQEALLASKEPWKTPALCCCLVMPDALEDSKNCGSFGDMTCRCHLVLLRLALMLSNLFSYIYFLIRDSLN
jgi:hypothetical protein